MSNITYSTQKLDHFGIVAGTCRKMGLVETIDTIIPPGGRKVTVGEATLAMILNALGFVGRPLYLTPEFFRNKPVDVLIRPGLVADDFNDDCLGRALDALYGAGLTETFAKVSDRGLSAFGIIYKFVHVDSSTISLHGKYEPTDDDPEAIRITEGYSKDHRPDLKQATLALMCAHQSRFPVWLKALDGNSSDKTAFPKVIQEYMNHFKDGQSPYFITDSAGYTEENIQAWAKTIRWVSRPPATITAVKQLYQQVEPDHMTPAPQEGYAYTEVGSFYGGVRQRWLVIRSEKAYKREMKTLDKRINKEHEKIRSKFNALLNKEFKTEPEAREALLHIQAKWRWHRAVVEGVTPVNHYKGAGRPKADQTPDRITFRLTARLLRDESAIEAARKTKGKFIVATNELDGGNLPNDKLLEVYKEQGVTVERGFRFLKDPMFFADSLFLKKPQRIMALLMVMGLSLLVFSLAEHQLQQQLEANDETIPNQVGKPTKKPTMRRVFQLFEGIDILTITEQNHQKRIIINLKPIQLKIIGLMGEQVKKIYQSPDSDTPDG